MNPTKLISGHYNGIAGMKLKMLSTVDKKREFKYEHSK